MSLLLLFAGSSMVVHGGEVSGTVAWTHSYDAKVLPNDKNCDPVWGVPLPVPSPADTSTIEDGALVIATGPEARDWNFYRLDGGPEKAWSPTVAGSTVEVKLRVVNQVPGDGSAQSLVMATGRNSYNVRFSTTGLYLGESQKFTLNTTNAPHVYRFVLEEDGEGAVYIDGDSRPAATFTGERSNQSYLDFGDCSEGQGGTCEWNYVRWTNEGAFPPPGAPR